MRRQVYCGARFLDLHVSQGKASRVRMGGNRGRKSAYVGQCVGKRECWV